MASSPAPTDPYETASAQGEANAKTAVINSIVGNPNEVNPYGTLTYSVAPGPDPIAGPIVPGGASRPDAGAQQNPWVPQSSGFGAGGGAGAPPKLQYADWDRMIFNYDDGIVRNQPINDKSAGITGGTDWTGGGGGGYGGGGGGGYGATPYSGSTGQDFLDRDPYNNARFTRTTTLSPQQQQLFDMEQEAKRQFGVLGLGQLGQASDALSTPFNLDQVTTGFDRRSIEDALMYRANQQLSQDRQQQESDLAARGLAPGSQGYIQGQNQLGRNANDLAMQAVLAGGNESRIDRATAIQEALLQRQVPLQEIGALLASAQGTVPQFTPYQPFAAQPAPIAQSVAQADQAAQQAAAQKNSMFSSILGAGIGLISDERAKENIEPMGKTKGGSKIYKYNYKGDPDKTTMMGVMAQEELKKNPEAVLHTTSGLMGVDYSKVK